MDEAEGPMRRSPRDPAVLLQKDRGAPPGLGGPGQEVGKVLGGPAQAEGLQALGEGRWRGRRGQRSSPGDGGALTRRAPGGRPPLPSPQSELRALSF